MAAREPTQLERLRDVGRYIDHSLLPTQNELPGVIAALIYGDGLTEFVQEQRTEGKTDAEISYEVAHYIAPPDPEAGATIVQGVPPETHQALLSEVAQLRQAVDELRGAAANPPAPATGPAAAVAPVTTGQTTSNAPPVNAPNTMTAEQQELQALREQVQRMQIQAASAQHPTGASEPADSPTVEVHPPAEPTPPAEPAPADTPPAADTPPGA